MKYYEELACLPLNVHQYKILLLLMSNDSLTLAMMAHMLGVLSSNLHKYVKGLEELNLIGVDRFEGNNKFYKIRKEDDINETK